MDLTIPVENYILNIRALVFIKNKEGYIFEKHKKGYYFGVGGRIKIGESSSEAAEREVKEELGIDAMNLKFKTIIENFFENIHEICFVYESEDVGEINIDESLFKVINKEEINNFDIRPAILKDIILNDTKSSNNYIVK